MPVGRVVRGFASWFILIPSVVESLVVAVRMGWPP
ncbi:hypothetical protein V525_20800 [Gordonia alkanivorans CGMCC 6845]|nr:hypothetical protein V525_20800 [Gordonia alkanivorans CGMCC 6845]